MDNPFKQIQHPLILSLNTDAETAGAVELICEDLASSIARINDAKGVNITVVIDASAREECEKRLTKFASYTSLTLDYAIAPLANIDWARRVAHDFPPRKIERFYVAGSYATQAAPSGAIALTIDASAAFGTGEHETTSGCLLALAQLHKHRRFYRLLDMGCGTAILAIAMYRLWHQPVLAVDNDSIAVSVARTQIKQNRVYPQVRAEVGNGYQHRITTKRAPYDLIVANILARPLMKMAHRASMHLARDGVLVLSGLLQEQEPMVLAAHRLQGLYLKARVRRGKWSVLILSR